LLFADDCIVFSEASQRGAARLLEILSKYNRGSGQLVNGELDIHKEALAEKYLGLPTKTGRSLSGVFEFLPAQV
jgi:hypothetical protein